MLQIFHSHQNMKASKQLKSKAFYYTNTNDNRQTKQALRLVVAATSLEDMKEIKVELK